MSWQKEIIFMQNKLGMIYLNKGKNWHPKAQPYLEEAASAGMLQASVACCSRLKALMDDPNYSPKQREELEFHFYETYRARFDNIPRMVIDVSSLKQEIRFRPLLERLESKLPPEDQKAINALRLQYYKAAEEQSLKGKRENINFVLASLDLLSIKPMKAIAKHFLAFAAAQKNPQAEQLLNEMDKNKKSKVSHP